MAKVIEKCNTANPPRQTFFITLHQKEFLYSENFDVTDGKVIE
jgi:hypothetical protein